MKSFSKSLIYVGPTETEVLFKVISGELTTNDVMELRKGNFRPNIKN